MQKTNKKELIKIMADIRENIERKYNSSLSEIVDAYKDSVIKDEFIQCAVHYGNLDFLKILVERGFNLNAIPTEVRYLNTSDEKYVPTPYVIQAARLNHLSIIEYLISEEQSIDETGFIGYSPKRRNLVHSNIIGAIAYNGFVPRLVRFEYARDINMEYRATEEFIGHTKSIKEVTGFTPLMLTISKGDTNLPVVKFLKSNTNADFNAVDYKGNTLVHLAIMYNCPEILKFLIDEVKLDLRIRNKDKETAKEMASRLGATSLLKFFPKDEENFVDIFANLNQIEEKKEVKKVTKKRNKKKRKEKVAANDEKIKPDTTPSNEEVKTTKSEAESTNASVKEIDNKTATKSIVSENLLEKNAQDDGDISSKTENKHEKLNKEKSKETEFKEVIIENEASKVEVMKSEIKTHEIVPREI